MRRRWRRRKRQAKSLGCSTCGFGVIAPSFSIPNIQLRSEEIRGRDCQSLCRVTTGAAAVCLFYGIVADPEWWEREPKGRLADATVAQCISTLILHFEFDGCSHNEIERLDLRSWVLEGTSCSSHETSGVECRSRC
ncbi:hypothetical protein BJY04DRAFT_187851 [Aspergillus karnatakaensis]|uniref:uncharacterized protein n=1 Tax=Aspergillus karnatakaensis TaxID=1810916 RepID=UPI003CCD6337